MGYATRRTSTRRWRPRPRSLTTVDRVSPLPQPPSCCAAAPSQLRRPRRACASDVGPAAPAAAHRGGHCFYVRRSALDLVGGFDEAFAPGYGEEVDFSQRCLAMGLHHVLADDVLVLHHGGASLGVGGGRNPVQDEHEAILTARYPSYPSAVREAEDKRGMLARSLAVARRAILEPTVTVDGRCLTASMTGTQVNVLEFVHALSVSDSTRIRVVTPPDLGEYAAQALSRMARVKLLPAAEVTETTARDDVVHRPYQISSAADMPLLRRVGERMVITHLDLISYRNPSYFRDAAEWAALRRLTRSSLNLADLVFFISRHAAADAQADGLLPPERTRVASSGPTISSGRCSPRLFAPREPTSLPRRRTCSAWERISGTRTVCSRCASFTRFVCVTVGKGGWCWPDRRWPSDRQSETRWHGNSPIRRLPSRSYGCPPSRRARSAG